MKKLEKVSVIILNWNCKSHIEANVQSILDQSYSNFEILFIDNGSTDGSIEYLKKLEKDNKTITLLETGENLGFVGGNNFGIDYVLDKAESEYVVIFNPDIWVEKDWLENLVKAFKDEKVAIATSKIYLYYPYLPIEITPKDDTIVEKIQILELDYYSLEYMSGFNGSGAFLSYPKKLKKGKTYYFAVPYRNAVNGEMDVSFSGGGITIKVSNKRHDLDKSGKVGIRLDGGFIFQSTGSVFNRKRMIFEDNNDFMFNRNVTSENVDGGVGAAMAIRADLLRTYGGFKKKYFMYFEDVELSYRFVRKGYKVRFVDDATCYHYYWGASGGKLTKTQIQNGVRNRLWFIREYFGFRIYVYHMLRALIKMISFGIFYFVNDTQRLYFRSYANALIGSFARYD